MLNPVVMISDFLESHAFPFVMQFCSRSFPCPHSRRPLQIPHKAPISLLSAQSLSLSVVSNWYQTRPPASIWNQSLFFFYPLRRQETGKSREKKNWRRQKS